MASHEVTIRENTGATKDAAAYLGNYASKETVRLEAGSDQMSAKCGLPPIQVLAILSGSFEAIEALERESLVRVHTDIGVVCGVITGSFPTADAPFDRERNSLQLALRLDDSIRLSLANAVLAIVNDGSGTRVRLGNIMDLETQRPMNVIHGQKPFRVAGFNMVMDDEGAEVYLQNSLGVTFPVTVDEVASRQLFTAHVAAAVEPGDYRLVVKSRGGDPEGVLQTTFRKVKYLAVAVGAKPEIAEAYSSGMESDPEHVYVKNDWDYVMNGANLANASVAIATTKEDGSALEVEVPADKLTATETKLTINGAWLTETMTDVSSDDVEVTFTITTPGGTITHKTTTGIA